MKWLKNWLILNLKTSNETYKTTVFSEHFYTNSVRKFEKLFFFILLMCFKKNVRAVEGGFQCMIFWGQSGTEPATTEMKLKVLRNRLLDSEF